MNSGDDSSNGDGPAKGAPNGTHMDAHGDVHKDAQKDVHGDAPINRAKVVQLKPRKCARCDNPVAHEFRPFCSRRCSNLDLGNWFNESYRVPGDEHDDGQESFPDDEQG